MAPMGFRWLRIGHSQLMVYNPSWPEAGARVILIAPAASSAAISLTQWSQGIVFETMARTGGGRAERTARPPSDGYFGNYRKSGRRLGRGTGRRQAGTDEVETVPVSRRARGRRDATGCGLIIAI